MCVAGFSMSSVNAGKQHYVNIEQDNVYINTWPGFAFEYHVHFFDNHNNEIENVKYQHRVSKNSDHRNSIIPGLNAGAKRMSVSGFATAHPYHTCYDGPVTSVSIGTSGAWSAGGHPEAFVTYVARDGSQVQYSVDLR